MSRARVFVEVARFELEYHVRQFSFAAATAIFLLAGFVLAGTGFGPDNIAVNSPYSIAESTGLASLLSVFVLAVFCANSLIRDREYRLEQLVFSTPVGKLPFLLGRFTGSFLAAFTAFSATSAGMIAGALMPWHDPARVAPIALGHYVWPLLVIGLPNLLTAAVILFATAALTRSLLATCVASVFIYVFYFVASAMTNSPLMASSTPGAGDALLAASLGDPFALSAFFEQTRHWSVVERNTRLVALTGNLLINRLLWTAGAALLWMGVYAWFPFRVGAKGAGKSIESEDRESVPVDLPAVRTRYDAAARRLAFLSALRLELRSFLLSGPFLALSALWAALAASEIFSSLAFAEYGAALLPGTGIVMETLRQPLFLVSVIVLAYYSAESVWRERDLRADAILHATPAPGYVFALSKWLTLAGLVGVLIAIGVVDGLAIQASRSWLSFEPGTIAGFVLLWGLPLAIFAAVAVFIQLQSPNKYAGMLLVVAAAILWLRGDLAGVEQNLFRPAGSPPVVWSSMTGFGSLSAFASFMTYWGAFAVLLLTLSVAMWRSRSVRDAFVPRSRVARWITTAAAGVFVLTGIWIFYNTNVLNERRSQRDVLDWQAAYERRYSRFAPMPQPRIDSIRTAVDLDPARRSMHVRGTYQLLNASPSPIDRILVGVRRDARDVSLALASATPERDAQFAHTWFLLQRPMAPGERRELTFDVTLRSEGFEDGASADRVTPDSTFVMSFQILPSIGYRSSYEIADPFERRRRGLVEKARREQALDDPLVAEQWVDYDATLTVPRGQIAVTSGRLIASGTNGGRRWFHYRSDRRIPNGFAFAAGRYTVAASQAGDTRIEVLHSPRHGANVARIQRAAATALRLYERAFGPYQHDHLRIVELPAYQTSFAGLARPDMMLLSENRSFLIDARDASRLDLVSRRVAHEVAHQWWGLGVAVAEGPGASMVVESVTKYAELLALSHLRGSAETARSLGSEEGMYLEGRTSTRGAERPLSRVGDEDFLYYRKGSIVFWALRDLLGEEALNAALRSFYRNQSGPGRRPTAPALVAAIRAAASPEQRPLVDEWMNDVTLYDFTIESARAVKARDGRYDVTLRILASKQRDTQAGAATSLPLDERIDVALEADDGSTLVSRKVRIVSGTNEVIVRAVAPPAAAIVDPAVLRIDRNRFDNRRSIER